MGAPLPGEGDDRLSALGQDGKGGTLGPEWIDGDDAEREIWGGEVGEGSMVKICVGAREKESRIEPE
ncbi:hypothetical protein PDE_06278 [Penicillium oxalicum 114-2]|uniref:Uncharacterized protein n=1 Tax=Penicillium oxalicum (strain 114-2 / CGMCC 5302) TaxID=933388 RepID=S8AYA7_PENO1|nr:hypothetical protein PDE_06278 [Penicillium oxalicum 114-2]